MAKKQPLYPHIPKRQQKVFIPQVNLEATGVRTRSDLRFLPDSLYEITRTASTTGFRVKLDDVFQQAIARAKGD